MKRTLAIAALYAVLALPAEAQDLDKGVEAAKRGDYAAALKEIRPLADQGIARAQYNLGVMYHIGLGDPQDYAEAVKWFFKAADRSYARAQHNLGVMYAKGQGVLSDYVQAHMWFNLAAVQGLKRAAENRNFVEKKITPAAVLMAQRLAREWMAKHGDK